MVYAIKLYFPSISKPRLKLRFPLSSIDFGIGVSVVVVVFGVVVGAWVVVMICCELAATTIPKMDNPKNHTKIKKKEKTHPITL